MQASVIIPTHDPDLPRLKRTIESLEGCEIIVVENPTITDKTAQFLLSLSENVIHTTSAMGANKARNAGAQLATGDILIFIDDDIVVPKGFVDKYVAAHTLYEPGVIGGPVELEYEKARPFWMMKNMEGYLAYVEMDDNRGIAYEVHKAWDLHVPIFSANMSMSKKVFEHLGGFDEREGYSGRALLAANDELRLISEAARRYVPGIMMINNPVRHLIPQERCTPDYIIRRAYGQGVADFRSTSLMKPKMTRLEVLEYMILNYSHLFNLDSAQCYIDYKDLDRASRIFATAVYARVRTAYIQGIMSQTHG
jgi:glycosyltransferase involved in cell wall biosynthesis